MVCAVLVAVLARAGGLSPAESNAPRDTLICDGRVREADGFPESVAWASWSRRIAEVAIASTEPQLLYGVAVLACALPMLLGMQNGPVFLALQLVLLLASRSEDARCAAATLFSPWPQLLAAAVLGAGLLYIHSALAYFYFGETLAGVPCGDNVTGLTGCIAASMVGPGLGPWGWPGSLSTQTPSFGRLALDLSCYITVGVFVLGSMLAIMLEAFEEVRVADVAAHVEAEARGESLPTHGHKPFAYILYLLYIRGKRSAAEPLTALESHIERQAAVLDPSWFPVAAMGERAQSTKGASPRIPGEQASSSPPPTEIGRAMWAFLSLPP